ncbi:MAG: presenilin family intramembrane aspartyl protease [archaeon]
MKHTIKITLILLGMFFLTQMIGIFVVGQYSPKIIQTIDADGNQINITSYNLPYGMDPPQDIKPAGTLISIVIAIIIAVSLMFVLMKYNAEIILRVWFFIVVTLAIGITINSVIQNVQYSALIAFIISLPIAYIKIFKRNILVHNITELAIYPGIASIFVPILNIWSVVLLLILISLYDMYAVWHAGFMQKMAKYQIQKLKVFSGFFVPYISKKQKQIVAKEAKSKSKRVKDKKIKVSVAILGGGDVVFPIILAGVVLNTLGIFQAIIISFGATLALAGLFWLSEKGKFYPAMPFITAGCFIALGIAYLI